MQLAGSAFGKRKAELEALVDKLIEEIKAEMASLHQGPSKPAEPKGEEPPSKSGEGAKPAEPGKEEGSDEGGKAEPHVVKPGENLWKIAKEQLKKITGKEPSDPEIEKAVEKIKKANPGVNPEKLKPGQSLKVPPL